MGKFAALYGSETSNKNDVIQGATEPLLPFLARGAQLTTTANAQASPGSSPATDPSSTRSSRPATRRTDLRPETDRPSPRWSEERPSSSFLAIPVCRQNTGPERTRDAERHRSLGALLHPLALQSQLFGLSRARASHPRAMVTVTFRVHRPLVSGAIASLSSLGLGAAFGTAFGRRGARVVCKRGRGRGPEGTRPCRGLESDRPEGVSVGTWSPACLFACPFAAAL